MLPAVKPTTGKEVAAIHPAAPTTVQEEHDLGPLVPSRTSGEGKSDHYTYTAAELMVLLKVGRSKIREMLRSREILSFKVGSLVRVRHKDLEEYIERVASAR
jgi:excisionase family DNA binding protein